MAQNKKGIINRLFGKDKGKKGKSEKTCACGGLHIEEIPEGEKSSPLEPAEKPK